MKHVTRMSLGDALPLAVAAAFAIGCETAPLARTNPLDPESPMVVEFVGVPDSIFSRNDTFRVTLITDPELPENAVIRWYGENIQSMGGGLFRANNATHTRRSVGITAEFGPTRVPRRTTTYLVSTQRVFSVETECDTGCTYTSLYWSDTLLTTPYDSLGNAVNLYFPHPDVTLISRDTTVVMPVVARVSNYWTTLQPRKNGQTWIVMSFGPNERLVSDSFPVTVQQRLHYLPNNCPFSLNPGAGLVSKQIVSLPPGNDPRGYPYQQALPATTWSAGAARDGDNIVLTVSSAGLVTYVSGHGVWFTTQRTADGYAINSCAIEVAAP